MGGFAKNKLADKRGYTYRLTRRELLVASSAAALAACAPGAVTPSASSSVAPGKPLKIGLLLPFSGVYAERHLDEASDGVLPKADRPKAR